MSTKPGAGQSPQFKLKQIAGANTPEQMSQYLPTTGWKPWAAKIHVGNVEQLVARLGGETLYGKGTDHFQVVLRELIQNSRDSIIARRILDSTYKGKIQIRIHGSPGSPSILEIEDDGVGMSERVLTGPLLDFGSSFWASDLVRHEFPGLSASSFRSVGQYGIGFYSVFMISKDVKVRSRRWDRGLESVCELHFPKGLSLRPVVSIGNSTGFSGYTSTIVSCVLEHNVLNAEKTRLQNSGYIGGLDITLKLEDYIAAQVPGLDVAVELSIDNSPSQNIHTPISSVIGHDARTRDWLSRLSFVNYRDGITAKLIKSVCDRLRPLRSRGNLVGFAALEDHFAVPSIFRGTHTIGGLATHVNPRTEYGFFGYLEVASLSAKREGHEVVAEKADLEDWAREQVSLLQDRGVSPLNWCFITANYTKLGIDPSEILHAAFVHVGAFKFLNLAAILTVLESEPIAIFKSRAIDHVETHSNTNQHRNHVTFVPLVNSNFLSLALEKGLPKENNSLIGCLDRALRMNGRKLAYATENDVASSLLGPIDAVLISAIPI